MTYSICQGTSKFEDQETIPKATSYRRTQLWVSIRYMPISDTVFLPTYGLGSHHSQRWGRGRPVCLEPFFSPTQAALELPPRTSEEHDMKMFVHIKLTRYFIYPSVLHMCLDKLQCFVLYRCVQSYKAYRCHLGVTLRVPLLG